MRIYELCLIFHPDTSEENQEQVNSAINAIIEKHSGAVLKTEKWGKKNFKYLIKKQTKGFFCFNTFKAETAALAEIERSIIYNESVLRFNIIRVDKFVAPAPPAVAVETAPDAAGTESEAAAEPEAETEAKTDEAPAAETNE